MFEKLAANLLGLLVQLLPLGQVKVLPVHHSPVPPDERQEDVLLLKAEAPERYYALAQAEKSVGEYEEDVGAVDLVHDHRPDGDGQPDEHGD